MYIGSIKINSFGYGYGFMMITNTWSGNVSKAAFSRIQLMQIDVWTVRLNNKIYK